MPLGAQGKRGICVAARPGTRNGEVFEFEKSPGGQIFSYRVREGDCSTRGPSHRRILANELPTSALRAEFVRLTGKTADEIGVNIEHP